MATDMTDDVKLEPTAEDIERVTNAICHEATEGDLQDMYDRMALAAILAIDRRAEVVGYRYRDKNGAWQYDRERMSSADEPLYASSPAPAAVCDVAVWQANMENAWAALRMIREAVETFEPITSLDGPDAVLLRGPEPVHEAEAIIEAILRLKPEPAVAVPEGILSGLRQALARAEYKPGDCPTIPVRVAAFMDEVRSLLAAAPEPPASPPPKGET